MILIQLLASKNPTRHLKLQKQLENTKFTDIQPLQKDLGALVLPRIFLRGTRVPKYFFKGWISVNLVFLVDF